MTGKRGKAKKPRDYKAEYRARAKRALREGYSLSVARGHPRNTKAVHEIGIKPARKLGYKPGTDLREIVRRDMLRSFGTTVRREEGDKTAAFYTMRLAQLQLNDGMFDWTDEKAFVEDMQQFGLTEREAYSALFGSP